MRDQVVSRGIRTTRKGGQGRGKGFLRFLLLLGEKDGVDIGQNSTLGNGGVTPEGVQLIVISDSQLDVARDDPILLVVFGGVARKLKDLGHDVLQHSRKVDRGAASNSSGV